MNTMITGERRSAGDTSKANSRMIFREGAGKGTIAKVRLKLLTIVLSED
jgi:hypothetical protein